MKTVTKSNKQKIKHKSSLVSLFFALRLGCILFIRVFWLYPFTLGGMKAEAKLIIFT